MEGEFWEMGNAAPMKRVGSTWIRIILPNMRLDGLILAKREES